MVRFSTASNWYEVADAYYTIDTLVLGSAFVRAGTVTGPAITDGLEANYSRIKTTIPTLKSKNTAQNPVADGTYTLQCVKSGDTYTYNWVSTT